MFVAVFAMLSLIYLIAGSISEGLSGHPLGMVIVDAINTLLFFCGAVALSAQLWCSIIAKRIGWAHRQAEKVIITNYMM